MNAMPEIEDEQVEPFVLKWEAVLGHEAQQRELRRLLSGGRLPHALLFSGADGTGKRLCGRLTAAAVLCEHPVEGEPCGTCTSCRALLAGGHPDYYELQPEMRGKGNRLIRIEAVRELTELAARYPVLSDRRVLLIDEADCMNEAAANCLLKTLEEPPGQVTFILVTGAKSALPETVISRCMPFYFGMLRREDMQALLERRRVPEAVAAELAILSGGSPGLALALYESDGLARRDQAMEFLQHLPGLSLTEVWQRAGSMGDWEKPMAAEWLMYFSMLLRDLLLLREDGGSPLIYHEDRREAMLALLPAFSEARIFGMLKCVRELQRRLTANVNLRLQLEGFFLRLREIEL